MTHVEGKPRLKPFYDEDGITIYHGDAREVLPALEVEADLIVTDPPYGIGFQSNRRTDRHQRIEGDDGSLDVPAALTGACRILKRGRHAYVFGEIDLSGTPLTAQTELIWDKEIIGMGDLSLPWGVSHEPITFALYEPSKANRAKGAGRLSARLRQGSVLRCARTHSAASNRHPTEKPVPILRQLIESSSVFGEVVLDPFMGSGSTLEAALLEGRRGIGIEVSLEYCESAVERLTTSSQMTLGVAA